MRVNMPKYVNWTPKFARDIAELMPAGEIRENLMRLADAVEVSPHPDAHAYADNGAGERVRISMYE